MSDNKSPQHPLLALTEIERDFVLHLVLASGSLKELAQAYGVSYPTIRARLDRLIARLDEIRSGQPIDPMSQLLAVLVERGEVSPSTAQVILDLHRQEIKRAKES
jgi:hypothetical protein